jgi:phosphoglycolate phosphatase-like HAD superfamily hydrolase
VVRERVDDGREAAHVVTARELVDQASAILLDFDGPVCSVFAGIPAAEVASALHRQLKPAAPWIETISTDDPLEIMRAVGGWPEIVAQAEHLLTVAEAAAVTEATPTDGVIDVLEEMERRATRVAIVSNNSEAAIRKYLDLRGLTNLVHAVIGRDMHDPRLMKPDPTPLRLALDFLRVRHDKAVMIGDSPSDIAAARALKVPVIAFANRDSKVEALSRHGPDAVITSIRQLVRC